MTGYRGVQAVMLCSLMLDEDWMTEATDMLMHAQSHPQVKD